MSWVIHSFYLRLYMENPTLAFPDAPGSSTAEELEMRCLQLQTQVWEMEVRHLHPGFEVIAVPGCLGFFGMPL